MAAHLLAIRTIITLIVLGVLRPHSAGADGVGSLLVESDPAGASVYLNGRLAGETPVTLRTIAAGVHRVRVVRLGYLEKRRLITVRAGTRATWRMRLTDPAPQNAPAAALTIVVLEGEGAVNIIQQKTAVAPVVEVRDRNNQPVSGAIVRFAIGKGRASFNGAPTLTVTTDAAGRARATGLTATSRGVLHIAASAAFQGQTAAVTIAQTTVMTAAQAASAAAGVAGGGGGGIGVGTITAIGAGIAGGVVGYQQVQKARKGDPPEIGAIEPIPRAGFQSATTFGIGGSIAVGSGDPDRLDARLQCEWGDGTSETKSMALGAEAACRHVYSSSGTFTIRQTVIDHWDRTASAATSVTVASMTGRWTSSASGGTYNLVQSGASITGTFTAASGTVSVSGSVSSGAFASTGTDPGRISLSLPILVGSTIVSATFAGLMPGDGDTNRVIGALSGPGLGGLAVISLIRQ